MVEKVSQRKVDCYIIIDWNNSKTRLIQNLPKKRRLKASEIPIKISLTLFIPKKPKFEIKGDIEVPQAKAVEMIVDKL